VTNTTDYVAAIDCVMAISTFLLAVATTSMAWKTASLVKQNAKYHLDSLRPVLTLDPVAGIRLYRASTVNNKAHYQFSGRLRNCGTGPAIDIRATIRFPTLRDGEPRHLPALGPGMDWSETMPGAGTERGQLWFFLPLPGPCPQETTLTTSPNVVKDHWQIDFDYADIFGNRFWTKHECNPDKPDVPWFRCGSACSRQASHNNQ
jgi:hypothetical protein